MATPNNWSAARPGTSLGRPHMLVDTPNGSVIATVAPSGTLVLPGPAQGFIRVFDAVAITPHTAVSFGASSLELFSATINPPWRVQSSAGSASSTSFSRIPPIGFGEALRYRNGAGNTVTIYASYSDVPVGSIVLIRQLITPVLVDLVPAPPAGYVNRFLQYTENIITGRITAAKFSFFNADTVAHFFEILQGTEFIQRTTSTAANISAGIPPPIGQVIVQPGQPALRARTMAAITTTSPNFVGAYETTILRGA